MADIDFSKYSDEELEQIASGAGNQSKQPSQAPSEKPYSPFLIKLARGLVKGAGQTVGDVGASALNAPIAGAEYLTGREFPHVPHPNFLSQKPESLAESVGQTAGQVLGGFALPGGAGRMTAQLAGKGYKALGGAGEIPMIAKLMAAMTGGAAEGALGNEEDRMFGAKLGAVLGGGTQGVSSAYNFARGMRSKDIAAHVSNEVKNMDNYFNQRFGDTLLEGEHAGANKFLKGEYANLELLKKDGNAKNVYALEKYNQNPTLQNAHEAQRDLAKIERKYKNKQDNKLETDIYKSALRSKNRLLQKISESLDRAGVPEIAENYQNLRGEYLTEAVPYIESPAVKGLMGKNKSNVQTIRPSQFADKLLQEEEFLARSGHKHPGLLRREKTKAIAKHPATKIGAVAAAAYLPYEIRKLLGK